MEAKLEYVHTLHMQVLAPICMLSLLTNFLHRSSVASSSKSRVVGRVFFFLPPFLIDHCNIARTHARRRNKGGGRKNPTSKRWHAKREAQSERAHVAHTVFFCTFRHRLGMLRRRLATKISASELGGEVYHKSALLLLVGQQENHSVAHAAAVVVGGGVGWGGGRKVSSP